MQLKQIVHLCMILLIVYLLCLTSVYGSFEIKNNRTVSSIKNKHITVPISSHELKAGDIAFKHPEAFPGPVIIDHCLLCAGYNNITETYEFIEAHFHYGVQSRFEKKENLSHPDWGPFARVRTATDFQKKNAIDFARKQIGKDFQIEWINKNYNPTDIENDTLALEWYCSELIWAAYYNCNNAFPLYLDEKNCIYGDGIDIDLNGWQKVFNLTIVAPREIIFDDDVKRILLPHDDQIDIFSFIEHKYSFLFQLSSLFLNQYSQ
jgi:hypothetical protein